MNLEIVDNRIKEIFNEYPALKNGKRIKMLIWYYWTKYEGLKETMDFDIFNTLTTPETITRARRKLLQEEKKDGETKLREKQFKDHYSSHEKIGYRDTGEIITI